MLNGYLLNRKVQEFNQNEKLSKRFKRQRANRKIDRRKLAEKYKARVEHFVTAMSMNIAEQNEYRDILSQFITNQPIKEVKHEKCNSPFVINGWKTERARIKEAIKDHQEFICEPAIISTRDFPKILRPRLLEKEIHPEMHFVAKNHIERLVDAVKANEFLADINTNSTNASIKKEGIAQRRIIPKTADIQLLTSKQIRKTHFKAIMAIVNKQNQLLAEKKVTVKEEIQNPMLKKQRRLKTSTNTNMLISRNNASNSDRKEYIRLDNKTPIFQSEFISNSLDEEAKKTNFRKPSLIYATVDQNSNTKKKESIRSSSQLLIRQKEQLKLETVEMGRKILSLCRITRCKSPNSEINGLRKGEGHLMSGFGMSNKQLYRRVFSP